MKKCPQTLTQKAMQALTEAVAEIVQDHRRRGIPIAVWQNGRPVSILPSDIGALHQTATP